MPSLLHATAAAVAALLFWTALGYPLAHRVFGHATALPLAPLIGWAAHGAVALPLFLAIPFTPAAIASVGVAGLVIAWSVARFRSSGDPRLAEDDDGPGPAPTIGRVAWAGALAVAVLSTAAMAPKTVGGGIDDAVVLSDPIFDHAKVSMIDEMARGGMPPTNPYLEHDGLSGRLTYYYLLHFSGAELVSTLGIDGWEADLAMTFFAVFTSLATMMAIAVRYAGRASAATWAVAFALSDSARTTIAALVGQSTLDRWIEPPGGFQGWFFQAAWVPQHLISTSCVLVALLAMARIARRPGRFAAVVLGFVAAAAFACSTWVGGVTFAACAIVAVPLAIARADADRRAPLVLSLAAAGILAFLLASPLAFDQLAASAARQAGSPIGVRVTSVVGGAVPASLRALVDGPAFWLARLPLEIGGAYVVGVVGLFAAMRGRLGGGDRRNDLWMLAVAAAVALVVSWLLVSRLADNNDLGWRAALLATAILIPLAAIRASAWTAAARRWPVALAAASIAIGLPAAAAQATRYVEGRRSTNPRAEADARALADAPALWARVRALTGTDERIANDPMSLAWSTPWPVNIGWSLLADRRSCYATWELTQVFSSIPHDRLRSIDDRYVRVFAGRGSDDDVRTMAIDDDCRVAVVTPRDGAWTNDPFAASRWYGLVDARPGRWRIYRRRELDERTTR